MASCCACAILCKRLSFWHPVIYHRFPTLQGLDELYAQSPAHRLLGPEHAAAIAAAKQQASGFEQLAGRRGLHPDAASAEPATPEVHRHGGQRGEALPLPTARKLASFCLCVKCSHACADECAAG